MPKLKAQYLKVYIDDSALAPQDVSKDLDTVDFPYEYEDIDVTGFTEGVVNEMPGMLTAPITFAGTFNPTSSTGLYDVLKGIVGVYTAHTVTIQIGQNAAPVTGDPEYEGEYWCKSMNCSGTPRGKLAISSEFRPFGATAPTFGTVA